MNGRPRAESGSRERMRKRRGEHFSLLTIYYTIFSPLFLKRPAMKMATLPGSAEDTTSFELGPSGRGSLPNMQWSGNFAFSYSREHYTIAFHHIEA